WDASFALRLCLGVPVWLLPHGQLVKLRSVHRPRFDRKFRKSNLPILDCRIHTHMFRDDAGSSAGVIYLVVRGLKDTCVGPFSCLRDHEPFGQKLEPNAMPAVASQPRAALKVRETLTSVTN